jgi:hypothetical protein
MQTGSYSCLCCVALNDRTIFDGDKFSVRLQVGGQEDERRLPREKSAQGSTHTAKNPTRCKSALKLIIPYLYEAQHVSAKHRPLSGA